MREFRRCVPLLETAARRDGRKFPSAIRLELPSLFSKYCLWSDMEGTLDMGSVIPACSLVSSPVLVFTSAG